MHRPSYNPQFCQFIDEAKKAGVKLIADYDDLIFNPKFAKSSSMFKQNFDPMSTAETFKRNTDGLRLFDNFTVSTMNLADQILAIHPDARILHMPNSIPSSLEKFIRARVFERFEGRKYIGYFPGTKTHDIDFEQAVDALQDFCSQRSLELFIVGPLHVDPEVEKRISIHRQLRWI